MQHPRNSRRRLDRFAHQGFPERTVPVISAAHPMLNDDSMAAIMGHDDISTEMLEIVGSERCLEILNVLNEVFDSFERDAIESSF
jgi:hypothetical protein